jgi:hypothetical protein
MTITTNRHRVMRAIVLDDAASQAEKAFAEQWLRTHHEPPMRDLTAEDILNADDSQYGPPEHVFWRQVLKEMGFVDGRRPY